MRRTLLGRTGLEISELAFGAGVTGGILIDADEGIRDAVLRRAVAAGIDWIDTAPVYGDGASEETIGRTDFRRGLTSPPRCGSKLRISGTSRARSSAAWSRACAACSSIGSRCSSCTIISAAASVAASR